MKELITQGVEIEISTNSLLSTDNLMAFSGYQKQRRELLDAGVKVYEFKDHPAVETELIERYPSLKENDPVFAIHAKSMVIDQENVFIGTFNLDPRSANLNTEVGVLLSNASLGKQLYDSIGRDMEPNNSWRITKAFNPDKEAPLAKRLKVGLLRLLPLDPVL